MFYERCSVPITGSIMVIIMSITLPCDVINATLRCVTEKVFVCGNERHAFPGDAGRGKRNEGGDSAPGCGRCACCIKILSARGTRAESGFLSKAGQVGRPDFSRDGSLCALMKHL